MDFLVNDNNDVGKQIPNELWRYNLGVPEKVMYDTVE